MTSFGKIGEISPDKETISNYLEHVEIFFQANGIDNEKKVPVFLSIAGRDIYVLLQNLLLPVKHQERTFAELEARIDEAFSAKKVIIVERFNFHQRNQAPDETIAKYVAELRKLTTNCDFVDYLEQALRDRFVCGLRSGTTQKQFLTKVELTLNVLLKSHRPLRQQKRNQNYLRKRNMSK